MNKKLVNPIIPGFYPDPTICRVGDDFYLACSSFEMFPGIPVFHSKDLANWEQIANIMTADNGFHMSKNCGVGGVMAPTLRYHDGMFYLINANFSDKGNFIVTAEHPEGPWSEPHWLDDVPGIDASFFFDNDGTAYIMGTGDVWENEGGRMERGIWLAEYDMKNFKMTGEPKTIFNSALRGGASPEAPHLYHVGDYYHLIIAEGGTEHYHAVMNARSKDIFGFYEINPANPVLTHRNMGFKSPIINVGHADLVDLPDGSWYAVMLASRLIDGECKNLGRETFICPVEWERDWPLFSPETGKVEWEYDAPASLPWTEYEPKKTHYDFDDEKLELEWIQWGRPYEDFYEVKNSTLYLKCKRQKLDEQVRPMNFDGDMSKEYMMSMLAQRQCEINETMTTQMSFMPAEGEAAGLAMVQAMNHQMHLERICKDGKQLLQFVATTADYSIPPYFPGFTCENKSEVLAECEYNESDIVLQIQMEGEKFTVRYGASKDTLQDFIAADGRIINPEQVGCMTGTLLGMYATGNGTESENKAAFDWFELG
ncbi:MAG: glycoside hydrolase family 43 protein [Hespellia sp.]|nr:glycoside hydrolase family 43 protein [Hespellia sp.]